MNITDEMHISHVQTCSKSTIFAHMLNGPNTSLILLYFFQNEKSIIVRKLSLFHIKFVLFSTDFDEMFAKSHGTSSKRQNLTERLIVNEIYDQLREKKRYAYL